MSLMKLLTQFAEADAGALELLKVNPGIINDPWVGEGFVVNNVHIFPGDAAIMVVSQSGSEGLVRELVRLGVNVNCRTEHGVGALMLASRDGHAGIVSVLLDNGAVVHWREAGSGRDALMYAAENGHAAVVALLLDHGADPNTRIEYFSALGLAAAYDHLPVCQLLLGRGADLYARGAYGFERDNALENYGCKANESLGCDELDERLEALGVAFAEGPHKSQVERRRNVSWARRGPFMLVLAGCGFRPLEMTLRLAAVGESSGGEPADAPLTRRDECVRIVFRAENLIRLVVSFL